MNGMSRDKGKPLSGVDHLRQSIIDILTTPLGSRVMRRDYGSRLFELVDAPSNPSTFVDIYSAVAEALTKWEPRLILTRVKVEAVSPGKIQLWLEGEYKPTGQKLSLEGLIV